MPQSDKKSSDAVRSAVCAMLKPDCDMFAKGEIINALMMLLKMSEKDVSEAIGLSQESIKRKRSLLCFSETERSLLRGAGISEMAAALLVPLPRVTRHFAVRHCAKNKMSISQTKAYIAEITGKKICLHHSGKKKNTTMRLSLGFLKDIGIVINSIERAVNTAKNSGFDVKYEKSESDDALSLSLLLPKKPFRNN